MIVAIAKLGDGTGQVPLEEFREAATTAAALTAFVTAYNTPLNEADYIAHDTGLTKVQRPADGNRWGYDHDTSSMVELTLSASDLAPGSVPPVLYLQSPDGNVWELTINDAGVLSGWGKVR